MTWTQIAIFVMAGIAITESLTCSSDADCTMKYGENSECNILEPCRQGSCVCLDGYQSYSGTCKAEIAINAACNFSYQCGDNAECPGSVCACETAYNAEGNGVDCELIKTKIPYGDPCTVDDECATTGAYCGDGVCKCSSDDSGFMYTGSKCQARTHGDACSSSKTCHSGLGLTCGSSGECECYNTTLKPVTFESDDFAITACIHNDASYNLGKGETCNIEFNEATARICKTSLECGTCPEDANSYICLARICKTSLECGTCPEDANSYICLDAGASIHFAASTVLFAVISAYVLSFV